MASPPFGIPANRYRDARRPEAPPYEFKDLIGSTIKMTGAMGALGLFFSAVQNALTRQNIGAWGVLTRYGGTTASFAAIGGSFEFTRIAAANLREKDDSWNPAIGGFFAGAVGGLKCDIVRTIPYVLGLGSVSAIAQGVFDYTGGSLFGYGMDPERDEYEHKEMLRTTRRRPLHETIEQLGEGRGKSVLHTK
ncbi:MAG: hypothetical protein Q9191_001737 [Dirinaria sp. TL-2023a]